jgi:hypothetical protein
MDVSDARGHFVPHTPITIHLAATGDSQAERGHGQFWRTPQAIRPAERKSIYTPNNIMETNDKQNTPDSGSDAPTCSAWIPIETAPNSLNVILVTDGESVWTDQKIGKYGDTLPGDYYFNGHENWEEVTHWTPIPSLPNAKVSDRPS